MRVIEADQRGPKRWYPRESVSIFALSASNDQISR